MPERRRFDWFSLVSGVATLLASAYVLADGPLWVSRINFAWALPAVLGVVGAVLLASSLSRRRD